MERRLAAILAADVVGYSKLVGEDQAGTLAALRQLRRQLMAPALETHRGQLVKSMGDGWLLEFPSAGDAVACAVEVQEALTGHPSIRLRIGLHVGDVVFEEEDIFGDGVNVASRLQDVAAPGGIMISDTAWRTIDRKLSAAFTDCGLQKLKNIDKPVGAFAWGGAPAGQTAAPEPEALPLPDKPSIAVLPFDNMSGDPEQEYFSDGITEDIITALSKYRWFFVSARNSTFSYKGEPVDVQQVGRDLGVRYVLEGSIRKAGDRVRVTAQLIEAETRNHIWADRFDGHLADIFDLQDQIQQAIVTAVEPELASAEHGRTRNKPPDNLDAWDLYLQGMWHLNKRTADDAAIASKRFTQAISKDPSFARAHAGHAWVLHNSVVYAWSDDLGAVAARCLALAQDAFRLDDRDPMVRFALGRAFDIAGNVAGAIREHRAAIDMNPNFAACYWGLARILVQTGQPQEALVNVDKAARLSPRDPMRFLFEMFRGHSLDGLGRTADAEAAFQQAIDLNSYPQVFWPEVWLTEFYVRHGRADEGRNVMSGLLRRIPDLSVEKLNRLNAVFDQGLRPDFVGNLAQAGLPD